MLNIKGIDHLVLRTGQVEQMCLFYCGVLGCTIERETPPDIGLIQLRAGNALIDLVSVDSKLGAMGGGPPTKSENNLDHFCLQLMQTSEQQIRSHLTLTASKSVSLQRDMAPRGMGYLSTSRIPTVIRLSFAQRLISVSS